MLLYYQHQIRMYNNIFHLKTQKEAYGIITSKKQHLKKLEIGSYYCWPWVLWRGTPIHDLPGVCIGTAVSSCKLWFARSNCGDWQTSLLVLSRSHCIPFQTGHLTWIGGKASAGPCEANVLISLLLIKRFEYKSLEQMWLTYQCLSNMLPWCKVVLTLDRTGAPLLQWSLYKNF